MKIVDVEKAPSTWTKLEKTIHEARNMAFLLTAAIDCDDEFYGEDKRDAIAFGIYEVEARIKEIRQAYHNAHEEGRTIRSEGEATTFTDDEQEEDCESSLRIPPMSNNITNQESFGAVAQTYVATRDNASERPRDPRVPAIVNTAKISDGIESDIAPTESSPPRRAMTRRSMFMGIAIPALTGGAIAPSATAALLGAPIRSSLSSPNTNRRLRPAPLSWISSLIGT
jgi:hypothetical protein